PCWTVMSPRAGSTVASDKPTWFKPTLVKVNGWLPTVVMLPPLMPHTPRFLTGSVSHGPEPPTVVLPASVREPRPTPAVPLNSGAPVLTTAPLPPTPVPDTVTGSAPRFRPARSSVALLVTMTPRPPRAAGDAALAVPPLIWITELKFALFPVMVSL